MLQKDVEEVWEALEYYFMNATENEEKNRELARPFLKKWPEGFLLGGFPYVAYIIEQVGKKTLFLQADEKELDQMIFSAGQMAFLRLAHLVSALGIEMRDFLISAMMVNQNEDERALMAFMFTDTSIPLKNDPKTIMAHSTLLTASFAEAIGTSCKMHLAWALYKTMGKKQYWRDLVYGDYFIRAEFIQKMENLMIRTKIISDQKELEQAICSEIALPESTPYHVIFPPQRKGVFDYLALDIASNGRAFAKYPKWIRKDQ